MANPVPIAYDYFSTQKLRIERSSFPGRFVGKFGDKFRRERERQNAKLEDVSTSTKISSRMLRAIEEEQFDQLPGGVFNKGFVRAYAKYLGLNDDEAVAGYLATVNQQNGSQPSIENRTAKPASAERRKTDSSERWNAGNDRRVADRRVAHVEADELPDLQLPKAEHVRPKRTMAVYSEPGFSWRLPAVVLLIAAACAIWLIRSRNHRAHASSPAPVVVQTPVSPAASASSASSSGDVEKTETANLSSVPLAAKTTLRSVSSSSVSPVTGRDTGVSSDATKEEALPEATAASAPTQPKANLNLVIHAAENSWISVTADGQSVLHETLIAPARTSVHAARQISVRAGNAAGISFSLNGEDFPVQGAEGEVKTLIFDASGMRQAAPPATPPTSPSATAAPPAGPIP